MVVKDVMTEGIVAVDADAPLLAASEKMKKHDVGALPVLQDGKVKGLVTDRDIVVRGVAKGVDAEKTPVSEMSTLGPLWVEDTASLDDAANLMADKQVRRLIVVNDQRKPVGMVSAGDLAGRMEGPELGGKVLAGTSRAVS